MTWAGTLRSGAHQQQTVLVTAAATVCVRTAERRQQRTVRIAAERAVGSAAGLRQGIAVERAAESAAGLQQGIAVERAAGSAAGLQLGSVAVSAQCRAAESAAESIRPAGPLQLEMRLGCPGTAAVHARGTGSSGQPPGKHVMMVSTATGQRTHAHATLDWWGRLACKHCMQLRQAAGFDNGCRLRINVPSCDGHVR